MLIGSCFTEHIGDALSDVKFTLLQNPNGILFDPVSVCKSLISYVNNSKYQEADLFQLNEVWNSWQHHSRFSHIDKKEGLRIINESQQAAHEFLKAADWLIITLGTSFSYRLTEMAGSSNGTLPAWSRFVQRTPLEDRAVANCHRAPAQWFSKHMLGIHEITESLDSCVHQLFQFNPAIADYFHGKPGKAYPGWDCGQ